MTSIAHVGHGYWGRNLARNFFELGHLAAIVDPNPNAAKQAAEAYGVRAASFDEVLSDPAIDGVSIASPAGQHFAQATAAIEAGKHVYVEKPLALDVSEAQRLCALAEARGRILMVGHLLQYHPCYLRLRELVAQGELGRLLHVYSNRLSLGKFRNEENVLWSFAPHDISMILGLVGEADGSTLFLDEFAEMPAAMQAHLLRLMDHGEYQRLGDPRSRRADLRGKPCPRRSHHLTTPIDIGNGRRVHPVGRTLPSRTGVFVRADVDQCRGVAMIRRLHDDQIALARVGTREPQSQFIGLAAGCRAVEQGPVAIR